MYELKKIGKVFTSKFVGTGPSSYKNRIYRAAVSQRLRNNGLDEGKSPVPADIRAPDRPSRDLATVRIVHMDLTF